MSISFSNHPASGTTEESSFNSSETHSLTPVIKKFDLPNAINEFLQEHLEEIFARYTETAKQLKESNEKKPNNHYSFLYHYDQLYGYKQRTIKDRKEYVQKQSLLDLGYKTTISYIFRVIGSKIENFDEFKEVLQQKIGNPPHPETEEVSRITSLRALTTVGIGPEGPISGTHPTALQKKKIRPKKAS